MSVQYAWGTAEYGLLSDVQWFSFFEISLDLGVDSVALLLVLLTTLLNTL
jgi:NADH:ubiquinone oxidoreductase subunit 4 (subunit M)